MGEDLVSVFGTLLGRGTDQMIARWRWTRTRGRRTKSRHGWAPEAIYALAVEGRRRS